MDENIDTDVHRIGIEPISRSMPHANEAERALDRAKAKELLAVDSFMVDLHPYTEDAEGNVARMKAFDLITMRLLAIEKQAADIRAILLGRI